MLIRHMRNSRIQMPALWLCGDISFCSWSFPLLPSVADAHCIRYASQHEPPARCGHSRGRGAPVQLLLALWRVVWGCPELALSLCVCIPVSSSWERWLSWAWCRGSSVCWLRAVAVLGLVTACQSGMHRAQAFWWLRRQPAQVSQGQSRAVCYEPCLIQADSTELFRSLQYAHKMPISLDFPLPRLFQYPIMPAK